MKTQTAILIFLFTTFVATNWRISIVRKTQKAHAEVLYAHGRILNAMNTFLLGQTNTGHMNTNHIHELWIGKTKLGIISNEFFYPTFEWTNPMLKD